MAGKKTILAFVCGSRFGKKTTKIPTPGAIYPSQTNHIHPQNEKLVLGK